MILGAIGEEAGVSDERLRQRLDALVEERLAEESQGGGGCSASIALGLGRGAATRAGTA